VGFPKDFVPDCPFKLCFWQLKTLTPRFYLTVPNFLFYAPRRQIWQLWR